MTPREQQYLKALVDDGLLSFSAAAELEQIRGRAANEPTAGKSVWDLAVAKGMVTAEQSEAVLGGLGEDAPPPVAAPPAPPAPEPLPMKEIAGFELIARLGRGSMGEVYKARQKKMDRVVALKILPPHLAGNQEFIERFFREARAAGRLRHPNIVLGIDAGSAAGCCYFAMEFVAGRNLGEVLRREGPLDEKQALEFGRQVAEALDYAHGQGLVHRDIKPENILITTDGQAKLCDLGLARGPSGEGRVTRLGLAVGTPYYLAPEQVRGEPPDHRADIYALGCTLYHLIAGEPPFQGESPMAVMRKRLEEDPPRLAEARPGTSRAAEAVIAKMLARAPAERYQSAREAAEDLRKVVAGGIPAVLTAALAARRREADAESRGGATAALRAPGTRPAPRKGTAHGGAKLTTATRPLGPRGAGDDGTAATMSLRPVSRGRWLLIATAGGLAILGGVGGFLWSRRPAEPPPENKTPAEPAREDPVKKLLAQLTEKFSAAQDYEKARPKDYIRIGALYGNLLKESAGSELEPKVQAALEAFEKRKAAEQAAGRLAALGQKLEGLQTLELSEPENYAEALKRYESFAAEAAGTDYEARAREAAEATRKRRAARAAGHLAAIRAKVAAARAREQFGAALAAADECPELYRPEIERELARLREETLAAGRGRWQEILARGRQLTADGKYDEAAAALTKGKALGLPEVDAQVAGALAEVAAARQGSADARVEAARKTYRKFADDFARLLAAGEYEEIRLLGQRLSGKLTPELEPRLRADLAFAAGTEGFLKNLRAELVKAKGRNFRVYVPLGEGFFKSYDEKTDTLLVTVEQGSSSVDLPLPLARMDRPELARITRVLLRLPEKEPLPPKRARETACYLLAGGKTEGVDKLLEAAKAGGEDVADLLARLAAAGGKAP